MKKMLLFAMTATLLVCVLALPAAAVYTLSYGLSEYGQQTFLVGKPTETPPTVDGAVSEGEYTNCLHLTPESEGMAQIGVTNQGALADYIDIYVSYDADNIYMAAVVQEDEYSFKNESTNNQYSALCVNFGYRTNGSSVQAMDRMECTLSINDSAGTSFFTGIGYYEYASDGKYYQNLEADPPVQGKDWSFMNQLMPEKKFVRTVDEEQKNITVYEFSMSKAVLKNAFRTDTLSDTAYFWFESYATSGGARIGNLAYRHLLSDEETIALIEDYGWCASFVGHLMVFGEEMELDLTVDQKPQDTEEDTSGSTDEPTAEPTAEPTSEPTDEPTAAPTDEPTPQGTDASGTDVSDSDGDGCKSAVALTSLALIAVVSCGVAVTCKKKR